MIQVQVTLFSDKGFKPVAGLVAVKSWEDYQEHRADYNARAIVRICRKRGWTLKQLQAYGYTTLKSRPSDCGQGALDALNKYRKECTK
jgi:hypothetical protein